MSKVVLLVNVELEPGSRDKYIEATGRLRNHLTGADGISYSAFENQGKEKDSFTEMFTFSDMATYEAFDEREDGEGNDIFAEILEMTKRAPRYTTLVEV